MAFKLAVLAAFVAVTSAGYLATPSVVGYSGGFLYSPYVSSSVSVVSHAAPVVFYAPNTTANDTVAKLLAEANLKVKDAFKAQADRLAEANLKVKEALKAQADRLAEANLKAKEALKAQAARLAEANQKAEATLKAEGESLAKVAYGIHTAFIAAVKARAPFHYSYGYEVQNAFTGESKSQYERRYGDVAVGNYAVTGSNGIRRTLDYTVDAQNGFNAVVRKEIVAQVVALGYARFAAPLAFTCHPAPSVYAAHAVLFSDAKAAATLDKAMPLAKAAEDARSIFLNRVTVEAPFHYSFGYEVQDANANTTKGQYESRYGVVGEGNYAMLEADGTLRSIDYTIDDNRFAVASPIAYSSNVISMIYGRPTMVKVKIPAKANL